MDLLTQLPPPLFYGVMGFVSIGWIAIILYPDRHWANYWVGAVIVPAALGVLYTGLMIAYWSEGTIQGFFSLPNVYDMFRNSGLLLAAWTDIVLLSLVAGAWVTRKAVQMRVPRYLLVPLQLIMFGFPGTGLAILFIVNAIRGRAEILSEIERATPRPAAPATTG